MARRLGVLGLILISVAYCANGFAESPSPMDKLFSSDGEIDLGPEYRGLDLRVIVVGGGGGGSASHTAPFLTRTGAGGGSGALVYAEIKIADPLHISWTLGKGGAGGQISPTAKMDGLDGGSSTVNVSSNYVITAAGGFGAKNIPSADEDGIRYLNPVPPLGGPGGIPWGQSGSDGNPSQRTVPGKYVAGGAGGKLVGIDEGGFGGNGGGTHAQIAFGGEEAGNAGGNGIVRFQISVPRPDYLSKQSVQLNPEKISDATASFDKFMQAAAAACLQQGGGCPPEVKSTISKIQNDSSLSLHDKASMMFGRSKDVSSDVVGTWAYTTLLSFLPAATRAIVTFVNLIPGDTRQTDVIPSPPPSTDIQSKTDAELNELYGSTIAATLWLQNGSDTNPSNQDAINALVDYTNAMKEEIGRRQQVALGQQQEAAAVSAATGGKSAQDRPELPASPGNIRQGVGNLCLQCASVRVNGIEESNECDVIVCP